MVTSGRTNAAISQCILKPFLLYQVTLEPEKTVHRSQKPFLLYQVTLEPELYTGVKNRFSCIKLRWSQNCTQESKTSSYAGARTVQGVKNRFSCIKLRWSQNYTQLRWSQNDTQSKTVSPVSSYAGARTIHRSQKPFLLYQVTLEPELYTGVKAIGYKHAPVSTFYLQTTDKNGCDEVQGQNTVYPNRTDLGKCTHGYYEKQRKRNTRTFSINCLLQVQEDRQTTTEE